MLTKSVIPIPPSYNKDETIDADGTIKYIEYLLNHGATTLMTTAGTSQFNLLNIAEIHTFNKIVSAADCIKILGVPPASLNEVIKFVIQYNKYRSNSHLMVLFPDRFYDYVTIYEYMSRIRDVTENSLYLHVMPMRHGMGGEWNFTSDIVSELFEKKIICGIKEEYSNLQMSYTFIRNLPFDLDVIVAGNSMCRHQFLRSAGANAFLAGIGNLFPEIEIDYCLEIDSGRCGDKQIALESKLFDVFFKHGWHQSLRIGLAYLGLLSYYNRMPWPEATDNIISNIRVILSEVQNEK